jgi:hypothetical protein
MQILGDNLKVGKYLTDFKHYNITRRMRWAGHVARMGEERKVYKVLVGRDGKRRKETTGKTKA